MTTIETAVPAVPAVPTVSVPAVDALPAFSAWLSACQEGGNALPSLRDAKAKGKELGLSRSTVERAFAEAIRSADRYRQAMLDCVVAEEGLSLLRLKRTKSGRVSATFGISRAAKLERSEQERKEAEIAKLRAKIAKLEGAV